MHPSEARYSPEELNTFTESSYPKKKEKGKGREKEPQIVPVRSRLYIVFASEWYKSPELQKKSLNQFLLEKKEQYSNRGYSDKDLKELTEAEAQKILGVMKKNGGVDEDFEFHVIFGEPYDSIYAQSTVNSEAKSDEPAEVISSDIQTEPQQIPSQKGVEEVKDELPIKDNPAKEERKKTGKKKVITERNTGVSKVDIEKDITSRRDEVMGKLAEAEKFITDGAIKDATFVLDQVSDIWNPVIDKYGKPTSFNNHPGAEDLFNETGEAIQTEFERLDGKIRGLRELEHEKKKKTDLPRGKQEVAVKAKSRDVVFSAENDPSLPYMVKKERDKDGVFFTRFFTESKSAERKYQRLDFRLPENIMNPSKEELQKIYTLTQEVANEVLKDEKISAAEFRSKVAAQVVERLEKIYPKSGALKLKSAKGGLRDTVKTTAVDTVKSNESVGESVQEIDRVYNEVVKILHNLRKSRNKEDYVKNWSEKAGSMWAAVMEKYQSQRETDPMGDIAKRLQENGELLEQLTHKLFSKKPVKEKIPSDDSLSDDLERLAALGDSKKSEPVKDPKVVTPIRKPVVTTREPAADESVPEGWHERFAAPEADLEPDVDTRINKLEPGELPSGAHYEIKRSGGALVLDIPRGGSITQAMEEFLRASPEFLKKFSPDATTNNLELTVKQWFEQYARSRGMDFTEYDTFNKSSDRLTVSFGSGKPVVKENFGRGWRRN